MDGSHLPAISRLYQIRTAVLARITFQLWFIQIDTEQGTHLLCILGCAALVTDRMQVRPALPGIMPGLSAGGQAFRLRLLKSLE